MAKAYKRTWICAVGVSSWGHLWCLAPADSACGSLQVKPV